MKVFFAQTNDWQAMLAHILKTHCGLSPLPELARTQAGKPYFSSLPGLHFNISHSKGRVLCALSRRPVGVDIEAIRPRREGLPRYALSPKEYAEYEALGADWPAFYTLWTRKEAWCKYTGQGLAPLWGQTPPEDGLFYRSYQGDGWRAAVCGEEAPPEALIRLEGGWE